MNWRILDTGSASATHNMALDYALLHELSSISIPTLHLYDWEEPTITYGYFLDPFVHLKKEAIIRNKLSLAKRPTGGGVLFHLTDFAFSLIIPATHPAYTLNTLQNYAYINRFIGSLIETFTHQKTTLLIKQPEECERVKFCMGEPTQYDVMIGAKKVAGGAQRRTRQGFLHQGSVSLSQLPEKMLFELLQDSTMVSKMIQNTFMLIDSSLIQECRLEFKNSLIYAIKKHF